MVAAVQVMTKLIQWADVVNVNQVCRQLQDIGADPDSIRKANPNAILAHFDAFGGPGKGHRSDYIGCGFRLMIRGGV